LVLNSEHVFEKESNVLLDDLLFVEGEGNLKGLLFADLKGILENEVSERHGETSLFLVLNDSSNCGGKLLLEGSSGLASVLTFSLKFEFKSL